MTALVVKGLLACELAAVRDIKETAVLAATL